MVKRIFSLCAAGNGPKRIAAILTKGHGGSVQRLLPQDWKKPSGTGHDLTLPVVFQQRHHGIQAQGNYCQAIYSLILTASALRWKKTRLAAAPSTVIIIVGAWHFSQK